MSTIRIIKKIRGTNLTQKEKTRIIILGLLEIIINFYKTILKLPFYLLGWFFSLISALFNLFYSIFELIATVFEQIVLKIDMIKDIKFVPKTDRQKVISQFQNNNKYKVI